MKKDKNIPKISENHTEFYFGKDNYKWMFIGFVMIAFGFLLMLGADANTINGKYDANAWNEDIFSFRRIRLAPMLVIAGFCVEVYAILKRKNDNS